VANAEPTPPTPETYTVTFDSNDGSAVATITNVQSGTTITAPDTPTREGYTFAGWYKDDALTIEWEFATDTVTTSITLYAKWTALYTVTFDGAGDTTPDAQTVPEGDTVTMPNPPVREKWAFDGWHTAAGDRWDFAVDTVAASLTLYARWTVPTVPIAGMTVVGDNAWGPGVFINDRTVTLSAFNIAQYETTYDQWYEVKTWAASHGYTFANQGKEGNDGTAGDAPTAAKFEPVTTVSWRDAVVWCNALSEKVGKTPAYYSDEGYSAAITSLADNTVYVKPGATGYRLPTEAEWEAAARGGDPANSDNWICTYAGSNDASVVAVYDAGGTANVGSELSNLAQTWDMSGNVWELCWDWYNSSVTSNDSAYESNGTVTDPMGAASGVARVLRGGGWAYVADGCTVSFRSGADPDDAYDIIGFRVVSP
jgi:uncharacterized repeat protein (TIGR02543 family)